MIRRRRAATRFANRTVAGRALADALVTKAVLERPVVLALPRGGVPVAAEVAALLTAPLGVILVRKIGVPGRSELAMGALAVVGGHISEFRNDEIIDGLRISSQAFYAARDRERLELERQIRARSENGNTLLVPGRESLGPVRSRPRAILMPSALRLIPVDYGVGDGVSA